MEKIFFILLFSSSLVVADSENLLFQKLVEMQQHNKLSIHLSEKCKYLAEKEYEQLVEISKEVGGMLTEHPENKLGESANTFIDVKMHERSLDIPCADNAENEVKNTFSIALKFQSIVKKPSI
jgi:hypothetical protein